MAETFTHCRATPPRMPQDVFGVASPVSTPFSGCIALQCARLGLPVTGRPALKPSAGPA